MSAAGTDGTDEPVEVGEPAPERTGPAKYLLPRSWIGRVVIAWVTGLVALIAVDAVRPGKHQPVAFWTLVVILAGFAISDGLRARSGRP